MREAGLPRGGMGRDGMGEQSPRPPSPALPVPRRGASAAPTAEPDGTQAAAGGHVLVWIPCEA